MEENGKRPPKDRVIICAAISERCFSSVFSFKNGETRPQMQLFTPAKPDVWFALGVGSNTTSLLRSRTNITPLRYLRVNTTYYPLGMPSTNEKQHFVYNETLLLLLLLFRFISLTFLKFIHDVRSPKSLISLAEFYLVSK